MSSTTAAEGVAVEEVNVELGNGGGVTEIKKSNSSPQ